MRSVLYKIVLLNEMLNLLRYLCLEVAANETEGEAEDNESLFTPVTGPIRLPDWWLPETFPLLRSDWLIELIADPSDPCGILEFHSDLDPETSSDILFMFWIECLKDVK